MTRRQFWIGLLIWLCLLGLGARWALGPSIWSERGNNGGASAEQVEKAFPFHMIDVSRSDLLDYAQRMADEDLEADPKFAAGDWCWRETQTRFIALFLLWMASGFFLHWFMGRIVRGEKDYTR
ncbi:MAG: hypothetical protein JWM16_2857 [Verrucomicrobiales bacterium]|nr:hypothetical protein [Verrucomicrobiales bacterium]